MQCSQPHPFHCASGFLCPLGRDTGQGYSVELSSDVGDNATPVALRTAGVITGRNTQSAVRPCQPVQQR